MATRVVTGMPSRSPGLNVHRSRADSVGLINRSSVASATLSCCALPNSSITQCTLTDPDRPALFISYGYIGATVWRGVGASPGRPAHSATVGEGDDSMVA